MPGWIRLAYTDFHPTGKRNQLALPADVVRVLLIDEDWIFDDDLEGFAFNRKTGQTISVEGDVPYFDSWPTTPRAQDGLPAAPRAWLDPPNAPLTTLGGGSYRSVGPLAAGPHGFIFLIDGNEIHRFYPDGTFDHTVATAADGLSNPLGVAVDQYRNVYVADTANDRIMIFQPRPLDGQTGRYSRMVTFGSAGSGVNRFDQPKGLTVLPNRVVDGEELLAVVDSNNQRVAVYRITFGGASPHALRTRNWPIPALVHLTDVGTTGVNVGEFSDPVDVACDRQRRLFVVDQALHRVTRFDFNAATNVFHNPVAFEKAGGGSGAGNGEFDGPMAIAFDWKNKYVYVADTGNDRVQRLDADSGNHLVNIVNVTDVAGVAVDSRGEVYSAEPVNNQIERNSPYEPNGAIRGDTSVPRRLGELWQPHTAPQHMRTPGYVNFDGSGQFVGQRQWQ